MAEGQCMRVGRRRKLRAGQAGYRCRPGWDGGAGASHLRADGGSGGQAERRGPAVQADGGALRHQPGLPGRGRPGQAAPARTERPLLTLGCGEVPAIFFLRKKTLMGSVRKMRVIVNKVRS